MTYDQAVQIIALLTEIRDRLPASRVAPQHAARIDPPTLFGYTMGSGEYPTDSQVRLARSLLAGDIPVDGSIAPPQSVRDQAQEIVDAADRRRP